jgi:methylated-DNA-protein-cysteine methyltransferase related protein
LEKRNYFEDVYEVVKLIPKGRVTSYGAIAKYLGLRAGARMVGWAMNVSHIHSDIPAHRVVNAQGKLTGKIFFGENKMQTLLEAEGIIVENDQILNFGEVFWNPATEL